MAKKTTPLSGVFLSAKMNKIITITTDFGDAFAAAQLHAVLATFKYDGKIIENHSVTPFSIVEGAFQIATLSRYTPKEAIHLGIVDPGVGSLRRGIILKNHVSWFIGPDNGLLYPAAKRAGINHAWHINEDSISDDVSNTFHGRDVFIKEAILVAQGKNPIEFGSKKISPSSINKLSIEEGQILHIDSFGNIKIYWPNKIIIGSKLKIQINSKWIKFPIVKTFSDVAIHKPLAYIGSSDTLELAINLGNAAESFKLITVQSLKIINNENYNSKIRKRNYRDERYSL